MNNFEAIENAIANGHYIDQVVFDESEPCFHIHTKDGSYIKLDIMVYVPGENNA